MIAIFLGQITGLVRGIIVARTFGASPELDAFFAANRVSETLFLLVAGGALGSAFIPTFTGLLAKDEKDSAWRLASATRKRGHADPQPACPARGIFRPASCPLRAGSGLSNDPELFALTISLLRIQLISAVFFGLGGLIRWHSQRTSNISYARAHARAVSTWDHLWRACACAFDGNLWACVGCGHWRGFISARTNSLAYKTSQLVTDHYALHWACITQMFVKSLSSWDRACWAWQLCN